MKNGPSGSTAITGRSAIAAAAIGGVGATMGVAPPASGISFQANRTGQVRHKTISIDGINIFYREAGPGDAPAILLLHGFPTSSHMFRHLIPALADRWRVIAPDYPGFGFSEYAARDDYPYSFAAFASTMAKFTDALGLRRYAIYIQDYGAPVGLRLALEQPDRVVAIIAQNGNAYEEGLSGGWAPIRTYWRDPSPENRKLMRGWLDVPGVRLQYIAGAPTDQIELFSPESWSLDWQLLNRPGTIELQLDLFYDYRTNLELYPSFHEFFRQRRPAMLIPWAGSIRSSRLPAPRPISGTCLTPNCIFSMPGISPSRAIPAKSSPWRATFSRGICGSEPCKQRHLQSAHAESFVSNALSFTASASESFAST